MNKQKFNVSHSKNATYKDGLRDFLEYRDLGISNATNGQYHAHIIRVKDSNKGDQEFHTTGLHQHMCKFQMVKNGKLVVLQKKLRSKLVHKML